MKHRHEYRVAAELQGNVHPSIWIESVTIQGFPIFGQKAKIEFGQVNHIYGDAGAGKTAILELLSGVLYGSDIERWRDFDIDLSITLSSSSGNQFTVDTTIRKGRPSYAISNNFALTFPEPYFVVFLQKELSSHSDDLTAIAKCYGMSPNIFEHLVGNPIIRGLTTSEYSLNICRTVPYLARDLMVNVGNSRTQSFSSCSGSEKSRVILDFGVLLATQMCRYRPVALLVDWINIGVLDIERFLPYVDYLFSSRAMFQTWFISPDPITRLPWRGWQKIKIERTGLKSVITQLGA